MAEAAASAGLDPDRLSFMRSINVVRRQVTDQAVIPPRLPRPPPGSWRSAEILERVNKGRRKRTYPRVIKKYIGRTYPVKQPKKAGRRHTTRSYLSGIRSDTGLTKWHCCQYTGSAFRDVCLGNGIIPSVGQTGICFDNAAAESWNATFKKELIHLHAWKNVEHVRQASFEFAEVYHNRQRIQKGLGYLTPSEYELGVDTRMAQMA